MRKLGLMWVLSVFLFTTAQAASRVSQQTKSKLLNELPIFGLSVGDDVFIRTFKKEARLELWMRPQGQRGYKLFRTYPICYTSGGLGPKRYTGDKTTPEGYYSITAKRLNPNSRFHLSMNIGYPNAYDRALGRTGSLLMIHGACDAVGCFAMGNGQIEEIYYLVEQALKRGQGQVDVHSFPFHLTREQLNTYKNNKWYGFWAQLQAGYEAFNATHVPPKITTEQGRYLVEKQ